MAKHARKKYRGYTIEGDLAEGFYIHHPSEAEDFGHRATVDAAKRLIDLYCRDTEDRREGEAKADTKYLVGIREVHVSFYEVFAAEDADDSDIMEKASEAALEDEAVSREYSHVLDMENWSVEKVT